MLPLLPAIWPLPVIVLTARTVLLLAAVHFSRLGSAFSQLIKVAP